MLDGRIICITTINNVCISIRRQSEHNNYIIIVSESKSRNNESTLKKDTTLYMSFVYCDSLTVKIVSIRFLRFLLLYNVNVKKKCMY